MRVYFDEDSVRDYEFANGRKPRGEGNWMFDVVWSDGFGRHMSDTVSVSGFFGDAKKEAMTFSRRRAPGGTKEACVLVCS
jgi:hypothetical protein